MTGEIYGPYIPAEIWTTQEVKIPRKEEFLSEEGWEVKFRRNSKYDRAFLFAKRDLDEVLGFTALRFMDAGIGYVSKQLPVTSLLHSGQWVANKGNESLSELVSPDRILVMGHMDNLQGIRNIRPNCPWA